MFWGLFLKGLVMNFTTIIIAKLNINSYRNSNFFFNQILIQVLNTSDTFKGWNVYIFLENSVV